MKRINCLLSPSVGLAVFFLLAGAPQSNAQTFVGYTCNPSTCFNEATGTGFFSSGITVTGQWAFQSKTYNKGVRAAFTSLGCTQSVTIESLGYDTYSDVFGAGVYGHSAASQAGVTLIDADMYRYYRNAIQIVNPMPTVPCA